MASSLQVTWFRHYKRPTIWKVWAVETALTSARNWQARSRISTFRKILKWRRNRFYLQWTTALTWDSRWRTTRAASSWKCTLVHNQRSLAAQWISRSEIEATRTGPTRLASPWLPISNRPTGRLQQGHATTQWKSKSSESEHHAGIICEKRIPARVLAKNETKFEL